jgi:hypothetical protein
MGLKSKANENLQNESINQQESMKKLLVYMPLTWPALPTKVFKSFLDMTGPDVQDALREKGIKLEYLISGTFPICRNRNEAIQLALSNKYNADYIFFADGDQIWPKNTLLELLGHISGLYPVVSGLYWRKGGNHACVQGHYSSWDKHENIRKTIEGMGFVDQEGNQCLFYKPLQDFDTMQAIDVSGMGCLLVDAEVFRKVELPWFNYYNPYVLNGDFSINHASEEMLFFCKLRKANIKTLVVPSVRCGHLAERVIGCPEQ